jgi:hypothetical protein
MKHLRRRVRRGGIFNDHTGGGHIGFVYGVTNHPE